MSLARYSEIKEEIKRRIVTGIYPPGTQLPTEKQLAEEFKVSRLTVGKSLSYLVLQGLISRTRGKGTFVKAPEDTAEEEDQGMDRKAGIVKVLCPPTPAEESIPGPNRLLEGLSDALKPHGFSVSINFYNRVEEELALLKDFHNSRCDGFIVWPTTSPVIEKQLQLLKQSNFPFVQLDSFFANLNGNYVVTDNLLGSSKLVRYLRNLGHRNIAYLSIPLGRHSINQRFAGFVAEMGEEIAAGTIHIGFLPQSNSILQQQLGDSQKNFLKAWLERIMGSPKPPTAIICSNDSIAIHLMQIIGSLGYGIPEHLSVAAFDNLNVDNWLPVPLTSIAHDFYQMGQLAGEILLHAKTSPKTLSFQYHIAPQLIIRKSTGPGPIPAQAESH